MNVSLVQATAEDAETLASLRVEVMRPSLEAVGRFNPDRARNRFLDGFEPEFTHKILRDGFLIGFFVLKIREVDILLDHLYISNNAQGQGIGAEVLGFAKSYAVGLALPLHLAALKGSKANQFYTKNGFTVTRVDEFDTYYAFMPINEPEDEVSD